MRHGIKHRPRALRVPSNGKRCDHGRPRHNVARGHPLKQHPGLVDHATVGICSDYFVPGYNVPLSHSIEDAASASEIPSAGVGGDEDVGGEDVWDRDRVECALGVAHAAASAIHFDDQVSEEEIAAVLAAQHAGLEPAAVVQIAGLSQELRGKRFLDGAVERCEAIHPECQGVDTICSVLGLEPISLAEIREARGKDLTKQHFTGRLLQGKLCIDAEVREGIIVHVVEDEQSFRYYLFLCNFASSWWTEKEARQWFPRDATVAIRDPVVSFAKDGVPCIEVLNPASLEISGIELEGSDEDPWKIAMVALENHEYIRAAHLFANFVHESSEKEDRIAALSYRSEGWLRAGLFDKALEDAEMALKLQPEGPFSSENLLRKARALLKLHDYRAALECFESSGLVDDNSREMEICKRFLEHSEQGHFDLNEYYLSRESGESTPECGEFVGAVSIGMSPDGKGRGLFATQDVKAGDVFFFCHPLSAMHDSEKLPAESDLLAQMVRNCMASGRSLEQLVSLVESDEIPELDLFKPNTNWQQRIGFIDIPACARKTSIDYGYKFERVIGLERRREFLSGLWILTAFANHSCCPSATQKAVGSASLVRAARDLKAGDEVTLAYLDPFMPWDVRSRQTKSRWGFECACERCHFESKLHSENRDLVNSGIKMEKMLEEPSNLDLFEVSEMACKVEKMISRWKGPDAQRHKRWMRASYYKAYEVYLLNREEFEKFITRQAPPPWEAIMEALSFTAPGYEGLLTLLTVFAQHNGNSSKARELLVRECTSCFGKLCRGTVDSILQREARHCAQMCSKLSEKVVDLSNR
ncbi:uncharacterized protein LOC112342457 [Selaginella moellendorffii]|uniref:uncharacterized protein LOC112342457 n=1 Tax=Selaginella moellendorffii TaxID=88036 RepID=UPI000D1C958A|nr:uncharacterized protein LOC112342457 [Selaginella moellendorffii]|eukprot:XP_024520070.1 uncharacterized protein LOC112342457 [Selaginella moellendorffii]